MTATGVGTAVCECGAMWSIGRESHGETRTDTDTDQTDDNSG